MNFTKATMNLCNIYTSRLFPEHTWRKLMFLSFSTLFKTENRHIPKKSKCILFVKHAALDKKPVTWNFTLFTHTHTYTHTKHLPLHWASIRSETVFLLWRQKGKHENWLMKKKFILQTHMVMSCVCKCFLYQPCSWAKRITESPSLLCNSCVTQLKA